MALLVTTNILGQNAPAIATTESQYAEYWAQDAAAMYDYAANSTTATTLTPFNTPQQNTNQTGVSAQTAAVNQATSTSAASNTANAVEQAASTTASSQSNNWLDNFLNSPLIQLYERLNTDTGGYQLFVEGVTFLASGVGLTAAPPIMTAMTPAVTALQAAAAPAEGAAAAAGLAGTTTPVTAAGVGAGGGVVSAAAGEASAVDGQYHRPGPVPPPRSGSSPPHRR